jgi:hypothetical protein
MLEAASYCDNLQSTPGDHLQIVSIISNACVDVCAVNASSTPDAPVGNMHNLATAAAATCIMVL